MTVIVKEGYLILWEMHELVEVVFVVAAAVAVAVAVVAASFLLLVAALLIEDCGLK